jgi:hypothetical protein
MINLTSIKMVKASLCPGYIVEGTFAFAFKYDSCGLEREEEEIVLYCEDRKENLIEGLVHELTEMTIKKLLIEFIKVDDRMYYNYHVGNIAFTVYHLATVLSLSYYGIQLEYSKEYESMLKDRSREK